MRLSDYSPLQPAPQIRTIINNLITLRFHKSIQVQRISFPREQSQQSISQASIPLLQQQISLHHTSHAVKTKVISKVRSHRQAMKCESRLQAVYARYMVNYLHKTNLIRMSCNVPAELSVLETLDEGDYLLDDNDPQLYKKKEDFPHYSNTIKLNELPIEQMVVQWTRFKSNAICGTEDNAVMKLKQIYLFVEGIFRRFRAEDVPIMEATEEVGIRFSTGKLLYDLLVHYYEVDSTFKREEYALKKMNEVVGDLRKVLGEGVGERGRGFYIPQEQVYVSLADVRSILRNRYAEELKDFRGESEAPNDCI